ncbi:hypothetical protein BC831DRAFT_480513 [Entophlyctis helioformis]|nr:hypothetical protein BC831DRAFT_480513 [Entophlyctis helioformis]
MATMLTKVRRPVTGAAQTAASAAVSASTTGQRRAAAAASWQACGCGCSRLQRTCDSRLVGRAQQQPAACCPRYNHFSFHCVCADDGRFSAEPPSVHLRSMCASETTWIGAFKTMLGWSGHRNRVCRTSVRHPRAQATLSRAATRLAVSLLPHHHCLVRHETDKIRMHCAWKDLIKQAALVDR